MKVAKKNNPFKKPLNFLVWFDGKIHKVSLAPHGSARFTEFHYHDEGWSSSYELLYRHGLDVNLRSGTDGTDCDGRLSTSNEAWCQRNVLAKHRPYTHRGEKRDRRRLPIWEFTDRSQRDYSAEAMGY